MEIVFVNLKLKSESLTTEGILRRMTNNNQNEFLDCLLCDAKNCEEDELKKKRDQSQ